MNYYIIKKLKQIRNIIKYFKWLLKGKPIPVDHYFKISRVKKISKQLHCITFIESGTFYGQMIDGVKKNFDKLMSVELDFTLYEYNKKKFSKYPKIKIFQGDSEMQMGKMIQLIEGRALFWLDGHYSGIGTAKGNKECPILAELNAVKQHNRNDHCILIDDARCFNGENDYPKLEEIVKILKSINNNYNINVSYDCIIAIPPLNNRN